VSAFDARFETLKARFVDRCASDLPLIERALQGSVDREVLRLTVHRMAGAAGTFGYAELSRLAGAVDDQLVEGGDVGAAELARLTEAVRDLVRA